MHIKTSWNERFKLQQMTEKKESKNERYIKKLEEHISYTQKAVDYSLERFDILIISLSTSGLILSVGFVKDIIKDFENINPILLKISWLLFALSLIVNLLSQVTGYLANKYEITISKNLIRKERNNKINVNVAKLEFYKRLFDFKTNFLNILSLLSLITAIILLIVFISNNM